MKNKFYYLSRIILKTKILAYMSTETRCKVNILHYKNMKHVSSLDMLLPSQACSKQATAIFV